MYEEATGGGCKDTGCSCAAGQYFSCSEDILGYPTYYCYSTFHDASAPPSSVCSVLSRAGKPPGRAPRSQTVLPAHTGPCNAKRRARCVQRGHTHPVAHQIVSPARHTCTRRPAAPAACPAPLVPTRKAACASCVRITPTPPSKARRSAHVRLEGLIGVPHACR